MVTKIFGRELMGIEVILLSIIGTLYVGLIGAFVTSSPSTFEWVAFALFMFWLSHFFWKWWTEDSFSNGAP